MAQKVAEAPSQELWGLLQWPLQMHVKRPAEVVIPCKGSGVWSGSPAEEALAGGGENVVYVMRTPVSSPRAVAASALAAVVVMTSSSHSASSLGLPLERACFYLASITLVGTAQVPRFFLTIPTAAVAPPTLLGSGEGCIGGHGICPPYQLHRAAT